jgi:hypothetical protein
MFFKKKSGEAKDSVIFQPDDPAIDSSSSVSFCPGYSAAA